MSGLLVAGTSSDAGKSALVTGLCRALARRGVDVVPFKAQNMSNNSMVCPDGAEIGRAQYVQATAAGVVPHALMNPVLLKPGTDRRSFIVLMGEPAGELEAGEYATGRRELARVAFESYADLAAHHELVICEGAGSPAEINLRRGDYVNMGLARHFDLPTILIGDIDRGGVLAGLYGTWALLDQADRALLRGYVINKFRGDRALLDPGLQEITRRTQMPCLGVLPWLPGVWIDGEDALQVDRWRRDLPVGDDPLRVAVVDLPRISNATDVDALAGEPGLDVEVTDSPAVCEQADLVVLPGSRSTVDDLAWLHARGIAEVLVRRHGLRRPILGICGGYEMLAEQLDDEVESRAGTVPGLGILPVEVRFAKAKTTRVASYRFEQRDVHGYEIHHGVCEVHGGEPFLDGVRVGQTYGTMLHASMENDGFRRLFLQRIAAATHRAWRPQAGAPGHAARREAMIDTLAEAVEEHLDVDALLGLAAGGSR
ncbi:adenosylcobyric acid synthase [Propionibacterium cyclohexanicum]|uniref:Cobyric acid synthase n=1 Tax=Propionibacterium cyclohexanicum TaxID=64702 RepID=A0A1H9TZY0_9ACTN|nr:cobyric acid synthase [Propionibacterium cyclohexanicum]SES02746.1 adenosylcobyric acid synthase [Propionibacterium cyclohexanicum]